MSAELDYGTIRQAAEMLKANVHFNDWWLRVNVDEPLVEAETILHDLACTEAQRRDAAVVCALLTKQRDYITTQLKLVQRKLSA